MVGIVIVSHSTKVAEGIKDIAAQMGSPEQIIVPAGGTDVGEIGTDPMKIMEAIEVASTHGEGVVVLADLGSGVMSVGVAKDLLSPELAQKVVLANAPILEGTIAAVVEASMGSDISKVLHTAEEARNMQKVI